MSETELKIITAEEVSKHDKVDDLWVVINGKVYDVTPYIDEHPGGEEVVVDCAGRDATEEFDDIGHSEDANEILEGLLIGKVEGGVINEKKVASAVADEGGVSIPLIGAILFALAAGAYLFLNQ